MNTSRRGFLCSLTGGIAAGMTAFRAPLTAFSSAAPFEPFRASPDQDLIRLHSNENAYGPSPRVLDTLRASLSTANRYPRLEYPLLVERIAALHRVKPEQVLLGCGSTEMLRTAAFAFLGGGKQLIQASPTFEAIGHYATAAGAHVLSVPLASSFAHDLEAMLTRVSTSTPIVYICNPNNPTASLTPRKDLELFISKLPASTRVVIDEAYHHYAGRSGMYASFVDHPLGDEKVIVTRTFSKVYGLAGMRLGYAVAAPEVIKQMRKFTSEDNINAAVTQAAIAAVDDAQSVQHFVELNSNDRQEFFNQAMARALKPIDSHANFVMMNSFHPADEVAEHFRKNNILIGRPFPPMNIYIRVSLGRPDEMQAFWQVWDKLPYAKNTMSH